MASFVAKFTILLIALVFGIAYYIDIMDLARQDKMIVEILLLFLAVTLVIRTVRTIVEYKEFLALSREQGRKVKSISTVIRNLFKTKEAIFLATTAPYVVLFPRIGFFVSSFIYVLAANILLGTKGKVKLIAIPTGLTVLIYLLFVVVFEIKLPKGILF